MELPDYLTLYTKGKQENLLLTEKKKITLDKISTASSSLEQCDHTGLYLSWCGGGACMSVRKTKAGVVVRVGVFTYPRVLINTVN